MENENGMRSYKSTQTLLKCELCGHTRELPLGLDDVNLAAWLSAPCPGCGEEVTRDLKSAMEAVRFAEKLAECDSPEEAKRMLDASKPDGVKMRTEIKEFRGTARDYAMRPPEIRPGEDPTDALERDLMECKRILEDPDCPDGVRRAAGMRAMALMSTLKLFAMAAGAAKLDFPDDLDEEDGEGPDLKNLNLN